MGRTDTVNNEIDGEVITPRILVEPPMDTGGMAVASPPVIPIGNRPRRSSSPLAFLKNTLLPSKKKDKKLTTEDIEQLSLSPQSPPKRGVRRGSVSRVLEQEGIDSTNTTPPPVNHESTGINNLPHTLIIKILDLLVAAKYNGDKSEIKLDYRPPPITGKPNGQLDMSGGSLTSSGSQQTPNSKTNPNAELETLSLVCKRWGKEITPQVFSYFIVKSPKHLRALIALSSKGLMEGGRPFRFLHVALILDKSSTFQKFMNIVTHTMPDRLPEKFVRATTKPILSNIVSRTLFTSFFEACASMEYFRFYQRWVSPDNFAAIGSALRSNQSITHLSFRNNNLGDEALVDVISALHENKSIEKLELRRNKLGNATAIALAGALIKNRTITEIDLFYNLVRPEGGVALANALRVNSSLKRLYLGWNQVGPQTAVVMAESLHTNATLETLHIDGIDDASGAQLCEALTTNKALTDLNLVDCKLRNNTAQRLGASLATNNHLLDINFRLNRLGNSLESIAKALATNTTLTRVNLTDNLIGDDEASRLFGQAFATNTSIVSLSLNLNDLGDVFGAALGLSLLSNNTLCLLDLSNNSIGLDGATHIVSALETNQTLRLVNLCQNNKITNAIGQVVGQVLRSNHSLVQLELAGVGMSNTGAIAIADAIAANVHLRRLNLGDNAIQDEGAIAFCKALKTNNHLNDLDLNTNDFTTSKIKEAFIPFIDTVRIAVSRKALDWKFQI
eukprot:gene14187-16727_t